MSVEQPSADPVGYVRRYTPNGSVAHLMWEFDWSDDVPHAVCGWNGWRDYWRGTGGQGEYERAAALPLCGNCQRFFRTLDAL